MINIICVVVGVVVALVVVVVRARLKGGMPPEIFYELTFFITGGQAPKTPL